MRAGLLRGALYGALLLAVASVGLADDWPQWGRDASKNMASTEADIPLEFNPGYLDENLEHIEPGSFEGMRWIAKLGSQTYGNPTIADGRVYVGTNNEFPRDPAYQGDRSVMLCLDEQTGEMLWQLNIPKLGAGKVSDWEFLGICSSPSVDGERVYVITNLCEVVCLDVHGLKNGNDGFQDEGSYYAGPGQPPRELSETDADVLWVYDMRAELGIFPHNVTSSSPLVIGDYVYANTSNGVDWSHVNIPSPRAPTLVCLDKRTGELLGEEASGISRRLMHCSWSSPGYGMVGERPLVFLGAGDGFCYGFDTAPVPDEEEGFGILAEVWRLDCNPPGYRFQDGEPVRYATAPGPSECIATPVYHDGMVYVTIGQDPEHGTGVGALVCIDADSEGTKEFADAVWSFTGIQRSISTVSIAHGLVFAADYSGMLYCLDAKTGELYWSHDTMAHIWGSTLVAGDYVLLGNEDGVLTVLKASKEKELVKEFEFDGSLYSSPVVANGILYVATGTHLFAIEGLE